MSKISLGGFNTVNGRTTSLGLESGLDSNAIIEQILSARQSNIDKTQDTIDVNKTKITEVANLRTLLDKFRSAADFLRSPPGVKNDSSDLFKYTRTSLSSNTSVTASNYLTVTSEAGATLTSYSISNITKALAHQIRLDGFTSKTASVVGNLSVTDNYQVNLGTIAGNVLNTASPIVFSNDVRGSKATIDIVFSDNNEFESDDSVVFGDTDMRFGGGGGDVDIEVGDTTEETVANMVAYLNSVTTGEESRYTYTASGNTITATRNVDGSNAEVDTSLTISADFTISGSGNQTINIGSQGASNATSGDLNTFGTDGNRGTVAQAATLDIIFGDQNQFDAADKLTIGSTTITFGGTGGDDIDISAATTLDQKLDAIVARLNAVSVSPVNAYTYSRSSSGVITMTRDTAGPLSVVGNDIDVTAEFSKGTDTTQTVALGKNYKNNGSVSGSVARSNSLISGSVGANGVDGIAAATKATVDVIISNNNIDNGDSITFGSTTAIFGTHITVGATLSDTMDNIVAYFNGLTTDSAVDDYKFEHDGTDTITITKHDYGSGTLAMDANFALAGAGNATIAFGSQGASTNPAGGTLNNLGTDGVSQTSISDAKTSHVSTLVGEVSIDSASFINGSSTATGFVPNAVEFRATVGGETYTSRPVILSGGDIDGNGAGLNGLGNRIPSGTVITFVKDSDSNETEGTKDVTFQLVVGATRNNINDESIANTYAGEINTWLNTTNDVSIAQNPTVPPFRAGTFNLGGVDITITEGENLQSIKSQINAVSKTSGVSADIIQVSENSYSLVLKSTQTGVENKIFEFGDGDTGDALSGYLQIGSDNVRFTQTQAARDASFVLDGQTITRSLNSNSDIIDGLTFNFISDTPESTPTTLTLNIDSDNDLIKNGISDFLVAYNNIRQYISKQTQRDENNQLVEGAVLGNESILRDVVSSLDAELSRIVSGLDANSKNSLFAIGIDVVDFPGDSETPATKDLFVLDEAKFDAALSSDFDAVRKVFTFDFTSTSSSLDIFAHNNKFSLNNFILDIDITRSKDDRVRVLDPNTNEILFNADLGTNSITGRVGTPLEGVKMVYTGDGTDIITVNATAGIADRVYNILDNYLKDDGVVDDFVGGFETENTRLKDRLDEYEVSLASERELLVSKFTRLEEVIAGANNTLTFLESQWQANNNSN